MHILSTALTFAGAGGLGLAAGLVLDYLGLLGARDGRSLGQLVLAALVLLVSGLLLWLGKRLRWRSQAVAHTPASTRAWRPRESLLLVFPLGPCWRRPTLSESGLPGSVRVPGSGSRRWRPLA